MRALSLAWVLLAIGCGGSDPAVADEFDDGGNGGADTVTDDTASGEDAALDAPVVDDAASSDTRAEDSSKDTGASVPDAAQVACGSATCAPDETCCSSGAPPFTYACVKGKSCPDGSGTLACDGPEDCSGGAICCADVRLETTCSPSVRTAECRSSCFNMGPTPCPGNVRLRRCRAKADCTQPGYTKCCVFETAGTSTELCANDGTASYAKSCK